MFSSAAQEFSAQGGAGGPPWGPGAASAESCTHPAKRDHCFPPPIAERQRLPNVGIPNANSVPTKFLVILWTIKNMYFEFQMQTQFQLDFLLSYEPLWGGWGCKVSCGGHHRPRGKTTKGSALDGAVFDIAQILAYLVHNMSRSQSYLGFGHFGWLPSFFGQ